MYTYNGRTIIIEAEHAKAKTGDWQQDIFRRYGEELLKSCHYVITLNINSKKVITTDYFISIADAQKRMKKDFTGKKFDLTTEQKFSALYCLFSDASLVMYNGIDDFISELYGDKMTYEEWKKAEKSYHACEDTYKKLKGFFTDEDINAIIEDLQENHGM